MAADLSLLFQLKASNTDAKEKLSETAAAVRALKGSTTVDFSSIEQAGRTAFTSLSQSIGLSTKDMLGLSAGIGMAIGALTAIAGAAVAAGSAIFALAQKSADYEGKLFDMSQQTNFAVETLSALQNAAKTSGSEIENIAPSLIIFQRNMEKAAESTDKQSNIFKKLKIDTKDNELALRQVFKVLGDMKTGAEQTAIALQFFGRSGKDVLGIIKETNGDLDAAMKKYTELGLTVSTKSAKAADEFGDSLHTIQAQLAGMARVLADQIIPTFNTLFALLSDDLKSNQANWETWGKVINFVVRGVGVSLLALINTFANVKALIARVVVEGPQAILSAFAENLRKTAADYKSTAEGIPGLGGGGSTEKSGPSTYSGLLGKGGGGKEESEAHKQTIREFEQEKNAIVELESATRQATDELKHNYDQRLVAFSEYLAQERAANEKRQDDILAKINEEQQRIDSAHARGILKQKEYDTANDELSKQTTKVNEETHKKNLALDEEEYKERLRLVKEYRTDREALDRAHEDSLLAILKEAVADKQLLQSQYLEAEAQTLLNQNARKKELLQAEIYDIAAHYAELHKISMQEALAVKVVTDAVEERRQKFKLIEDERVEIARRTSKAIADAFEDEVSAVAKAADEERDAKRGPSSTAALGDAPAAPRLSLRSQLFGQPIIAAFKAIQKAAHDSGGSISVFQAGIIALGRTASEFFSEQSKQAGNFSSIMGMAASSIVQGLVDIGTQWILTGHTGEAALRKLVASTLAAIFQQAAIKAVWEGAEALAEYAIGVSLAANPFTAALAPGHFAAAAAHTTAAVAYGALAGGAAILGRTIAGGAFQQGGSGGSSGGSGGGTGGGAGGGGGSSSGPTVINAERNNIHFDFTFRHEPNGAMFHTQVVKTVVKDYRGNGQIRSIVNKDK